MINFELNTKQIDKWLSQETDREKAKGLMMSKIVNEGQNLVQDEASKITTTGELENSVIGRTKKDEVEIWGAEYGDEALETGRGPGKVNPVALKRWARIKLGNENLAYEVANKIEKQGTRKHRKGGPKQLTTAFGNLQKYVDKQLIKFLEKLTE